MAYLKRPQKGERVLQSLYDSVNSIIDYLPSITVRGDNNSTYVEQSSNGTVIHARQRVFPDQSGGGGEYYPGSGLSLSGNIFNVGIDNKTIKLVNNKLSCTVSGGGGGGPDTNDTYTGDANYYGYITGNHIYISPGADYSGDHLVSSTLKWLQELNNNNFCEDGRVTFPTTSHVITSNVGVNSDHCIVPGDLIHDGLGTTINYSWMRSPFGDETTAMVGLVNGLQVDLTLSGGQFADVVLYQNKGGFGPVSHETEPPTESTINVLLTGTYDRYPHTSGFIDVVPTIIDGKTWGVVSTNLHAGSGIVIDQQTGEISCTGSVAPTPGSGGVWPNYDNLGEESDSRIYPLMRYTTSTGGWLRISLKSGTSRCVGVWIDDNYVGLGMGIMTWPLAIPPGCSFYVDVDWALNNLIWFDSTVTPGTVTKAEMEYWQNPPMWEDDRPTINQLKDTFNNARSYENQCYQYMTGALGYLNAMINDWKEYEHDVQTDPDAEPESVYWYEEQLGYISSKYSDCQYPLDEATDLCISGNTYNNSLPNPNPMYTYQFTDIPLKSQEYYDQIGQYITSGEYYKDLAVQFWNSRE